MSEPINRIQFLRGNLHGERKDIHPPWSLPEALFIEACNRCGDCHTACPQGIIHSGNGGFPRIDFSRAGCTFCGECVKACDSDAMSIGENINLAPWALLVEIRGDCLSINSVVCRSCGEQCEESAIRFHLRSGGRAQPVVDTDNCNGCGECVAVCPTQSISIRPHKSERAA